MPMQDILVSSTLDGEAQRCLCVQPAAGRSPLLVALHHWSRDCRGIEEGWSREAQRRGWACVQPDFRGPNNRPQACGSKLAQQDILDAIDWALRAFDADPGRVYLAGASGGGHMTMLMAARHPQRFAAASAWVGISDLAAWHREHARDGQLGKYAQDIERCVGGPPGSGAAVDRELYERSPIHHLARARDLPLDLAAGVHDGHTGSVPIHHTLDAFNVIAAARGDEGVSAEEIHQLQSGRRPIAPPSPDVTDFGARRVHLRRYSGPSRVTIFEGGHEGLADVGCAFLARHERCAAR